MSFNIAKANELCRNFQFGKGEWKHFERTNDAQKAADLQKLAEDQKHGKRHFQNAGETAASVLPKNDVYAYETENGPTVYIIAYGDSDSIQHIDKIMGCESNGAVRTTDLQAVHALSGVDKDFHEKAKEAARKAVEGGELSQEQKAVAQAFLPPKFDDIMDKLPVVTGTFGFASTVSSVASVQAAMQAEEQPNEVQQLLNEDVQRDDQQDDQQDEQQPETQQTEPIDIMAIIQETGLVALVVHNIPMNAEQISMIMESIENGTSFTTVDGREISVTSAMTPDAIRQINKYLEDNPNCGIEPGVMYKELCAELLPHEQEDEQEDEQEEEQENQADEEQDLEEDREKTFEEQLEEEQEQQTEQQEQQEQEIEHEKDVENFVQDIGQQLEQSETLPEPPQQDSLPNQNRISKLISTIKGKFIKQGGRNR